MRRMLRPHEARGFPYYNIPLIPETGLLLPYLLPLLALKDGKLNILS